MDGFNALFFKKSWQIIEHDIYAAVNEFFQKEYLHGPLNVTIVTLVPKNADARYAIDYRPISCCTTLYKIISKVITHRLNKVIGEIVNQAQSRFIPGRHIADNIVLATELMRGYGRAHISPRCVIKVDIRKAYDSLEWSFLETMLMELGFLHKCIRWIMAACVKSVSYSLLINGIPTKEFKAKKRLETG